MPTPLSPKQRGLLEEWKRRQAIKPPRPSAERFKKYQADPAAYARDILRIEPWAGVKGKGQLELFQDIGESVRAQLAGEPAIKIFRVEAGHGVGKTFGGGVIVNWFFDCFGPSITLTTAPTEDQVKLLLWKDIKSQRKGRGLPGRVLPDDPKMIKADDWFAIGRTTSDNQGKGSERLQGQHGEFILLVTDEAEGVPDFVFDAYDAMMTGGTVVIWLMMANPQTRTSRFHKKGKERGVSNYRLSVLDTPNVVYDKDIVPGATRRDWVIAKIETWCDVVPEHDEDANTFTVSFPVEIDGVVLPPGTIFRPNPDFCFRVLGIAPANLADRVFVSPGRYESACARKPLPGDGEWAQIGVDCARFGADAGTVYVSHRNVVKRSAQVFKADTYSYVEDILKAAREVRAAGAKKISIRIDGTGGFGAGIIDALRASEWLQKAFALVKVHEVQFGANAYDGTKYADIATEMYGEAAESLKGLRLERPPVELEVDLCERTYGYVNRAGVSLKKLTEKEVFRKDFKHSPDDGDGCVLAIAPEHIFRNLYVHHDTTPASAAHADPYEPLRDEFDSFSNPY